MRPIRSPVAPTIVLIAVCLGLAGCATGDGPARTGEDDPADRLLVTRDDGGGGQFRILLDCDRGDRGRCERIAASLASLQPSDDEVCADVFFGPETIELRGTLADDRVALVFDRSDSCAEERYQRLSDLLRP